jgi:hypothetical protein
MHDDQPDLARIVDELAGDMPDATALLADITNDELAAAGQIAIQRRLDDKAVVGQIAAALYMRLGKKSWRDAADMLGMPHMTIYRWAQPFLGS